jgi:hypothetical protein
MNRTILRPGCCNYGVDVLMTNWSERCHSLEEIPTFAFGGAAFGLQANLTTLS